MRFLSDRETKAFMDGKPRHRDCMLSAGQALALLIVALCMVAVACLGNIAIGVFS